LRELKRLLMRNLRCGNYEKEQDIAKKTKKGKGK
jgi:hypothetical protein